MKLIKDFRNWIKTRKWEKEQRKFNRAFCNRQGIDGSEGQGSGAAI
jgi:hypothetical protein